MFPAESKLEKLQNHPKDIVFHTLNVQQALTTFNSSTLSPFLFAKR